MARLVGINHVAIEVGDLDRALAWYGQFFELELRGRIGGRMAFVDMGDHSSPWHAIRPAMSTPEVLRGMDLELEKSAAALAELREAGLAG